MVPFKSQYQAVNALINVIVKSIVMCLSINCYPNSVMIDISVSPVVLGGDQWGFDIIIEQIVFGSK